MRPLAAVLAIFLVCSLISAQIEVPQLVKSASIMIDENGTVSVSRGELRSIEINLSIPVSATYQEVSINDQLKQDSEGNQYVRIASSSPSNPFTYSRQIGIQTNSRSTPLLPSAYMVPAQYSKYSSATARTQSDDSLIRSLALQVSANSTDPFEKVAKLAIFVNKYMAYNEQMVGQEKDALWVLENKQGVCVEYSTLFAALARSIGVPVRYISGYVYSEKYSGWLGHAWNEAYIGEWVPVDATWFEVGTTDALHIEGSKDIELSREPSLIASVTDQSAEVQWDTTGKSGAFADNIATINIVSDEPSSGFELRAVQESLAPGGKTLAYLAIKGKDYRVVSATLAGCVGGNSVSVVGGEQFLILRPGKTSVAVWELSASKNIPSNYVYTCPLTLNSPYLENRRLDIQVDPRLKENVPFQSTLQRENMVFGQENSVLLSLPSARQGEDYYVITEGGARSQWVSSATASLPFYAAGLGQRPLYVAGEKGGYKKLGYTASMNQTSVSIDDFSVPEGAIAGLAAKARATVSSKSYPADISILFSFEGRSYEKTGRISAPTEFEFDFTPTTAGSLPASVRAAGEGGAADERSQIVVVESQPKLVLSGKSVRKMGGKNLELTLTFTKIGNVLFPKVKIGDAIYTADSAAKFGLQSGTYTATLSWKDHLGNQYSQEEGIEVKEPGIIDTLGGAAPSTAPPCPAALILFASLFAVVTAKR